MASWTSGLVGGGCGTCGVNEVVGLHGLVLYVQADYLAYGKRSSIAPFSDVGP